MKFSDLKNEPEENGSSGQKARQVGDDLWNKDANSNDYNSKEACSQNPAIAESAECIKWEWLIGNNSHYLSPGRNIQGQALVDIRQWNDEVHLSILKWRRKNEEWQACDTDAVSVIKLKRETSQRKLFKGDRALVEFNFDVRVGPMLVPAIRGKTKGAA